MATTAVQIRIADKQDVPSLLDVYDRYRERAARSGRLPGRGTPQSQRSRVEDALLLAVDHPDSLVMLAEFNAQVCGLTLIELREPFPGAPPTAMCTLLVSPDSRRRGVGRELLRAAVGVAEERGVETVAVTASPTDRDTNHYFSRLGFAPVSTTRTAPVAALHRRLTSDEPPDGVVARRRLRLLARARAGSTPPL